MNVIQILAAIFCWISSVGASPNSFGIHVSRPKLTVTRPKDSVIGSLGGFCEGDCQRTPKDGVGECPPSMECYVSPCHFSDCQVPGCSGVGDNDYCVAEGATIGTEWRFAARLYYGDYVHHCHFQSTMGVSEDIFQCDLNNMRTVPRCDSDGMGDIAIEIDALDIVSDLIVNDIYIDGELLEWTYTTKIEYSFWFFEWISYSMEDTSFSMETDAVALILVNEDGANSTINNVTIRKNVADGLADFTMTTHITRNLNPWTAELDAELYRTDDTGITYVYHCQYLIRRLTDDSDSMDFECDAFGATGNRWSRQVCEGVDTETVTFRTAALYDITIASYDFGLLQEEHVQFFCVPGDLYPGLKPTHEFDNEQECGCSSDSNNEYGLIAVSMKPDGYPIVTLSGEGCDSSDLSDGWHRRVVTHAYHQYELSITACDGIDTPGTILNVIVKGSNGNTAFARLGDEKNGGTAIEDLGWSAAGDVLQNCQGDCLDNGCFGRYECMHNDNLLSRVNSPPGCTGAAVPHYDYCYDPAFEATSSLKGDGATSTYGIGHQDIGDLVFIEIVPDDNALNNNNDFETNFCLKQIEWKNNVDESILILAEEYIGDGVFLVKDGYPYLNHFDGIGENPSSDDGPMADCQGDCGDDRNNACAGTSICHNSNTKDNDEDSMNIPGCAGSTVQWTDTWDYCGPESPEETDRESVSFQRSGSVYGLYLPSTPYVFHINLMESHRDTVIDLVIHVCGADRTFALLEDSTFGVYVSGRNADEEFESSSLLPLNTGSTFASGEQRRYSLSVPLQLSEIVALSFVHSNADDMMCIDMVQVNGKQAFLTETFLGTTGDASGCEGLAEECPTVLYAVLSWPICAMEVIGTPRTENEMESTSNHRVAVATCSNPNRFLESECEVSQEHAVTTYEERTYEVNTELTVGVGFAWSEQMTSGPEENQVSIGYELSVSYELTWGHSTSDTSGAEKSDTVTCSGSASVPPLHSLPYSVVMSDAVIQSTTYTDLKFTKCAAAFDGISDDDLYIYLYNVPGTVETHTGQSCSVQFESAQYQAPSIEHSHCSDVAKMASTEFGTYAPICQRDSNGVFTTKWEPCQCAYGDSYTEATCGCVDEDGLPVDEGTMAVLDTSNGSDYSHYSEWCEQHCPNSYYPNQVPGTSSGSSSGKMVAADVVTERIPVESAPTDSTGNMNWNLLNTLIYVLLALAVASVVAVVFVIIYLLRRMCSRQSKYQPVVAAMSDTDCV